MQKVKLYTATCITSKFGNFKNGKDYPVYYKDVYASSGLPASPYIVDEDGDYMTFDWVKNHRNYFDISYIEVEFERNKDYNYRGEL